MLDAALYAELAQLLEQQRRALEGKLDNAAAQAYTLRKGRIRDLLYQLGDTNMPSDRPRVLQMRAN